MVVAVFEFLAAHFVALTRNAVEQNKTTFAVRIFGGSRCASSRYLQTVLFFQKHHKLAALLQSRGDETSALVRRRRRRRKCSCGGCSENRCDPTGERAPGICSLTGCERKNVCCVLLITATTTYLIPGTSHVLDVDESSYNENTIMNCSSEDVYMNHQCKHCLINNNNNIVIIHLICRHLSEHSRSRHNNNEQYLKKEMDTVKA